MKITKSEMVIKDYAVSKLEIYDDLKKHFTTLQLEVQNYLEQTNNEQQWESHFALTYLQQSLVSAWELSTDYFLKAGRIK